MVQKEYSREWRVYFPRNLRTIHKLTDLLTSPYFIPIITYCLRPVPFYPLLSPISYQLKSIGVRWYQSIGRRYLSVTGNPFLTWILNVWPSPYFYPPYSWLKAWRMLMHSLCFDKKLLKYKGKVKPSILRPEGRSFLRPKLTPRGSELLLSGAASPRLQN